MAESEFHNEISAFKLSDPSSCFICSLTFLGRADILIDFSVTEKDFE